jgi:hypothetical protein
MPSNFDWIFKRDPYAAERERASGYVSPLRGSGRFALPRNASGRCPGRAASPSRVLAGPVNYRASRSALRPAH